MSKLFLILSTILFALYHLSAGLECYYCYNGVSREFNGRGDEFVACNPVNLSASNTIVFVDKNAKCVYQVVEIQSTRMTQTWRTYSKGALDPCDPNNMMPGVKLLECKTCTTDRCNLFEKGGNNNNTNEFTFNINANVNLYIRQ